MSHTQQRHPANGSTTTFATPQPPSTTSPTHPASDRHRSTPPVHYLQRFRVTLATTSSPKTNFFDLNLHQRQQTRFVASHLTTSQPPHQHFHQSIPTLPNSQLNSPDATESLSSTRHSPSTNSGLKFTNQTKQINRLVFTSPNPDSLGMPTVNLNPFTHDLWNPLAT